MYVILSGAKNLNNQNLPKRILRFTQDDGLGISNVLQQM